MRALQSPSFHPFRAWKGSMKAVFYLDALLTVLPIFLMLYTYVSAIGPLMGDFHFNAVTAKVERIAALSTVVIYDYSEDDGRGTAIYGYVKHLPSRVEVEFPVEISTSPGKGNCIYRIVWDGNQFVKYHFCG